MQRLEGELSGVWPTLRRMALLLLGISLACPAGKVLVSPWFDVPQARQPS
jgi:hypothetical protein